MADEGQLGDAIERKSAEIRTWPAWAQPFRVESTSVSTTPSVVKDGESTELSAVAESPRG